MQRASYPSHNELKAGLKQQRANYHTRLKRMTKLFRDRSMPRSGRTVTAPKAEGKHVRSVPLVDPAFAPPERGVFGRSRESRWQYMDERSGSEKSNIELGLSLQLGDKAEGVVGGGKFGAGNRAPRLAQFRAKTLEDALGPPSPIIGHSLPPRRTLLARIGRAEPLARVAHPSKAKRLIFFDLHCSDTS